MSRLTYKSESGMTWFVDEEGRRLEPCEMSPHHSRLAIEKLAHYEDLEEAVRLITLPCAVGDTVYKLWYKPCHKGVDYPNSYLCCGCEDECTLERAIFEFNVPSVDWILAHMRAFGDWVWFLTKAEAEAKLAELKEGAE